MHASNVISRFAAIFLVPCLLLSQVEKAAAHPRPALAIHFTEEAFAVQAALHRPMTVHPVAKMACILLAMSIIVHSGHVDLGRSLAGLAVIFPFSPERVVHYLAGLGERHSQISIASLTVQNLKPGESALDIEPGTSLRGIGYALGGLHVKAIGSDPVRVELVNKLLQRLGIFEEIEHRGGTFDYSVQDLKRWQPPQTYDHVTMADFTPVRADLGDKVRIRAIWDWEIPLIQMDLWWKTLEGVMGKFVHAGSTILVGGPVRLRDVTRLFPKESGFTLAETHIDKDRAGTRWHSLLLTVESSAGRISRSAA